MTRLEHFFSEHWLGIGVSATLASVVPSIGKFMPMYDSIIARTGALLGLVLLCLSIYAKYKEIKKK